MKKEDLLKIFPELNDDQYAEIQRLNGLDVNPIKAERDSYKSQLDETKKSLKGFEDLDIAGKDKTITDLQNQIKTKEKEMKDTLKKIQFESGFKLAIAGQVHDEDLVLSLIPQEQRNIDENGKVIGLDDLVKNIKESKPFLFKTVDEPKELIIDGFKPVGNKNQPTVNKRPDNYDQLSLSEQIIIDAQINKNN